MSCDLTGVGRLERNINLSDSFLGVITVKLKNKTKQKTYCTFNRLVGLFMLSLSLSLVFIRELKGTRLMEFPNKTCKWLTKLKSENKY